MVPRLTRPDIIGRVQRRTTIETPHHSSPDGRPPLGDRAKAIVIPGTGQAHLRICAIQAPAVKWELANVKQLTHTDCKTPSLAQRTGINHRSRWFVVHWRTCGTKR